MSNLTRALLIVMSINVLFFLAQGTILNINSTGTQFYNCEGTILSEFEINRCEGEFFLLDSDIATSLPQSESAVSPEEGNVFTDIYNTAKGWVTSTTTGVGYLIAIFSAPASFLAAIGLPDLFVFGISALWGGLTFFLFIAWLFGREK